MKSKNKKENKITLVKIPGTPTPKQLEYWRKKFESGKINWEELNEQGVEVEEISGCQDKLTLVKIGDDEWYPTIQDCLNFRQVFQEAAGDPNFTIFTHSRVSIQQLPVTGVPEAVVITGVGAVVAYPEKKLPAKKRSHIKK